MGLLEETAMTEEAVKGKGECATKSGLSRLRNHDIHARVHAPSSLVKWRR